MTVLGLARKIYWWCLGRVWLVPRGARIVLTYHDISSPGETGHSSLYSTPVEKLREQLAFLSRRFRFVSLEELVTSASAQRLAAITFDDGFRSVLTKAHPVLREFEAPYTVFVNGRAVLENALDYGEEYPQLNERTDGRIYLTEAELRAMALDGVELGSHGYSHAVFSTLSPESVRLEIRRNQEIVTRARGSAPVGFAFPFGKRRHFLPEDEQLCREEGFRYLLSTEPEAFLPGGLDPKISPIPRLSVTGENASQLRALLNRAATKKTSRATKIFVAYSGLTIEDPAVVSLLASLRLRGLDVRAVLINGEAGSGFERGLARGGIPTYHVPYRSKKSIPGAVLRVAWLLARERATVVHSHLIDANLVALTAGLLARVSRRYYTRHHSSQNHVLFPHAVAYDLLANRLATKVIAITKNVRDFLHETEHVPVRKIELVNHGFDLRIYEKVTEERVKKVRARHGIPEGRPVVGIFSRYIEWKGVQFALPAFERVLKERPDAFFVFANAYPSEFRRTELAPAFARLPLGSFVEIQHEPDVEALYRSLSVFVHVPYDPVCEAFGLVYVEPLLLGIPCVFTLSGIAPEFVRHEENALVVPFRDPEAIAASVVRLLNDGALRARLQEEGRRSVEQRFKMENTVRKLEALYR